MISDELKTKLMQLAGIGRPTKKEVVDGSEIETEVWSEEDTATTIKSILDENERLENELKNAKDRYINDFLKTDNKQSSHESDNQEIKVEDYINI